MPYIHLTTFIAAPVQRVFDLSRSIDLHRKSMQHTGESPVAGTSSGLIGPGETVTWKAKHLWKERVLQVKITAMQTPDRFTDIMVAGDFKSMQHEHHFKVAENGTIMIDLFQFEAPYGLLGKWFSNIYLRQYMQRLLEQRNAFIKSCAEGNQWKQFLNEV